MLFKSFQKSYYKYKIVVTFSVITILLVAVLSKVSYDFMYDFYLKQLKENVTKTTQLTAEQIDEKYLSTLQKGIFTYSTKNYFDNFFKNPYLNKIYSELFIFDDQFNVLAHSNPYKLIGNPEPRLSLNSNEIFNLEINHSTTSLSFKGNDDNWYLWGFHRLSNDHWLAVRASADNFQKIDDLAALLGYFGVGGIVISILLGFFVAKSITNPITKLVKFSSEIGKGKLNNKVPANMKGELKILSSALVQMRNNISNNQKEKEKILAQIAHEIRNPLGGIELLINLINESTSDETKNKEYTEKILEEIDGLKELITSYLDYSRPTPAQREKINLRELILESTSIFEKELSEKDIVIKTKIETKDFIFDRIHLRNVLINLIKNSIESISQNGEIVINTFNKNSLSFITVADNGSGISDDNLNAIFEPFFTTKSNGTGLGLASCKKYCDENLAELNVENLKTGCIFSISKEYKNE
ncbi:MAG: HAMP domain-containing sensor histidine kinase [Bacteroidota bacterium]